ncbi:MAG: hypothetical protein N2050_00845 [Flavobacteriales bacterium]|nr:hypothetical protein [Flavobacteriales bacterium]
MTAQKWSGTLEWENILSSSFYKNTSDALNLRPRFRYTAFPNLMGHLNYHFSETMGLSLGFGMRNLGLILANDSLQRKWRNIALCAPLTFRIGRLRKPQFAALMGMAANLMIFYKETTRLHNYRTDKRFTIFSEAVLPFNPSFHAGVQVWMFSIKYNITLFNYLNRAYVDNMGQKPFKDTRSPLWWLSVSFHITRNWEKEKRVK